MAAEKATGLVLRTTDWSETSRIATIWTRELGKVRVLAKGGRRLKSNFEVALDLLTLCSIVLLRKSSGSLDLLTEAQVVKRFPHLSQDLAALYGAYYIAELLSEWTQDYDPHPNLFDEATKALEELGTVSKSATAMRIIRFECVLLQELGYEPSLEQCIVCGNEVGGERIAFSVSLGGVLCDGCQATKWDKKFLLAAGWTTWQTLSQSPDAWKQEFNPTARAEVRQMMNQYVTYHFGRKPKLLTYLGS